MRRLLEPAALVDHTRHCRRCASAHQHFLDVCPHCASLHIRRASSLHCFTCGHVAPEVDFRTEGGLTGPKCSASPRRAAEVIGEQAVVSVRALRPLQPLPARYRIHQLPPDVRFDRVW